MNGPNNVTIFNTEISAFPTSLICDRLNQLSKSKDYEAMGDNEILSEAAKRLDNLHNAHLHHPDCMYWKWDWKFSWDETDCTCNQVGENIMSAKGINQVNYRNVTTEPSTAEIRIMHDLADQQINRFGFVAAYNAHQDRNILLKRIEGVEKKLSRSIDWAIAHVPKEYSNRGLSDKFLRGDNAAGGAYELATEIQDILKWD